MPKKNKLMLAAAVIAVLLLVGSGVARCSLAREDVESTNSAIEAIEKEEAPTSQQGAPAEGTRIRRRAWRRSSAPPGRA